MAKRLKDEAAQSNVPPEVILQCAAEFTVMEGEQRRITQRMGTMFKRFAKHGVEEKSIRNLCRLQKMENQQAKLLWQTDTRYLQIAGLLEWDEDGQGDFGKAMAPKVVGTVSLEAELMLARARATNDGYNSAVHGAALDANPFAHAPGSEQFVAWRDGWVDGSADRAARQEVAGKPGRPRKDKEGGEKQAQPRKRGRPRKNGTAEVHADA